MITRSVQNRLKIGSDLIGSDLSDRPDRLASERARAAASSYWMGSNRAGEPSVHRSFIKSEAQKKGAS